MINFKDMIGGFLNESLLDITNADNQRLLAKLKTDEKFFIEKQKQIAITPLEFSKKMGLEFYQNFLPNDANTSKSLTPDEIEFHRALVQLLINNLDESLTYYKKDSFETYLRRYIGSKLSEINSNLYSCITAFIDQIKFTYDADKAAIEAEKKAKQSSKGASSSAPVSTVSAEPSMSGKKAKKTSIDYSDIKEWIYSFPTIKEISSKSSDEIFKLGFGNQGNLNGFYKMKNADLELKKIDKQINIIVTAFTAYNKNVSEDLSLILTKEKRAYYDQFLKILPFFVDKSEVDAKDVFIDMLESKNYVLYFYLDGLYYEFIRKETDERAPNNHYMINDDFKITKIRLPLNNQTINKSATIKMRNITFHKHFKNLLVTEVDKSNIFKSFRNTYLIYKQFQNSNENKKKMFRFLEYMFHQPIENGEIVPKKPLIGNIINLFILTGNLETLYKFFGSVNTVDYKIHPMSGDKADIIISLRELGMDKMASDDEKNAHILFFDISKLLINKFRDFITTNLASFNFELKPDTCDQILGKINELIPRLNHVEYAPGIPDVARTHIEMCKRDVIELIKTTAMFLMEPKNKEGINLINAYNYFDIIDNTDLLTFKINDIEKRLREDPTSVTSQEKTALKDMLGKVNGNLKKSKTLVFYHAVLDIAYLRKISYDTKQELTNAKDHIFIDYILDVMVVYRQNYEISIPFNKHLLTHSNRAWRAIGPDTTTDEIYSLVKTSYNTFAYGAYTRKHGADCGETAILNIFNYLIFNEETGNLDISKLPDNVHPKIKSFYTKYNRLEKIDTNARYQWDEIMYDYEFVMQTHDYCVDNYRGIRYKVYSQFENLNGFVDTIGIPKDEAIRRFQIYDETGNLLPGKKENKYTGHTIRPGYISFVKILNKLTGFDKTSEKYNDRFVMSNLTLDSFKEILQTFKNSTKLDDYVVLEGTDIYDEIVRVKFNNFAITMRYGHAFVEYGGIVSDRRGANAFDESALYRKLGSTSDSKLRYYQKSFTGLSTYTSPTSDFQKTTISIETFKRDYMYKLTEYLTMGSTSDNIEYILNLYKLCLSDEEVLELPILPGSIFVNLFNPEDNLFFKIFGKKSNNKLTFNFKAFNAFARFTNYKVIKHLIYYLDGVNNPINDRKDTILNLLFKFNNETMIRQIMLEDKPDILILNQYGNNILHYQQFIYDDSKIESNIKLLKELVDENVWNQLVIHKNIKEQIPFMAILSKSNIYVSDLLPKSNRVKVNLIKQVLIDYFKKQNNVKTKKMTASKRADEIRSNYEFLSKIRDIIGTITNTGIKHQVCSLLVKITDKKGLLFEQSNFNNFNALIDQELANNNFPENEKFFVNSLTTHYLFTDPTKEQNITSFNKIFNKDLLSKYNVNPWFSLNIDPSTVTFESFVKILIDANKIDMLPLLGLVPYVSLFKECVKWSIKNFNTITGIDSLPAEIASKGLKSLVDYNGNTIYHNLAIMSRYLMIIEDLNKAEIKKLFGVLNKDSNREIFIKENNNGWKLIDIFSWFPYIKDNDIGSNSWAYDNIRTCVGLLDDYFKNFNPVTQNIEDYVIVLTRHLISKWFRYFDQTNILITTINSIVESNSNINDKLLSRLGRTFNLHLYDDFLTPAIYINRDTYLSEPNFVLSIGQVGNPLLSKQTFKRSNDITIRHPLTENQLKKLNFPENPYLEIENAFDDIVSSRQVVGAKADQLAPSVSANELNEKSAENKYYLLYKKYKTKYLTLTEKLSK